MVTKSHPFLSFAPEISLNVVTKSHPFWVWHPKSLFFKKRVTLFSVENGNRIIWLFDNLICEPCSHSIYIIKIECGTRAFVTSHLFIVNCRQWVLNKGFVLNGIFLKSNFCITTTKLWLVCSVLCQFILSRKPLSLIIFISL